MNHKISVVITVWNGANYLSEAIQSALDQDYLNKEIIVVNDGSTDETLEIILSFGESIRVVNQENKGLGAARNAGVRAATGDYYAFLDHDDLWPSRKLSEQMSVMMSHEEDPLVFSYLQQFICPRLTETEKKELRVNESILPAYFASNLLISKKRFEQIGFFMQENKVGEFVEWYARALRLSLPMVMSESIGLLRRVHKNNMGRQHDRYKQSDYLKILKTHLNLKRSELNL